mmetsp:Transcript_10358/g.19856  ORF Transcript_10358/g.19856 Transcript_10358/m.19856 type:complete len:107 (-) Transcript_10358:294-614(-)
MDKLSKAPKAGGMRVNQRKHEKKAEGEAVQATTIDKFGNNPAQELASQMHEAKQTAVMVEQATMKQTTGGKKFPATYNAPAKASKFCGTKMINAKARVIQQPRKHN